VADRTKRFWSRSVPISPLENKILVMLLPS
jgi:hypothetical protein